MKNAETIILKIITAILYAAFAYETVRYWHWGPVMNLLLALVILCLMSIVATAVHECGHLIGGILTRHRLVLFRVFHLCVKKDENRWNVYFRSVKQMKRIPEAGWAAGQCLMIPDKKKPSYTLYQMGGLLMNLVTGAVALYMVYAQLKRWELPFLLLYAYSVCCVCKLLKNGVPVYVKRYPMNDIATQAALEMSADTRTDYYQYMWCIEDALEGKSIQPVEKQTNGADRWYCDMFWKKTELLKKSQARDQRAD